jgi:hypothetical protein
MGEEDVEALRRKLARMAPRFDGIGQRLWLGVPREDTADDDSGLLRLADGSIPRCEHGHVMAARGKSGRRSGGKTRRPGLPVGEPLVDGDENAHG